MKNAFVPIKNNMIIKILISISKNIKTKPTKKDYNNNF